MARPKDKPPVDRVIKRVAKKEMPSDLAAFAAGDDDALWRRSQRRKLDDPRPVALVPGVANRDARAVFTAREQRIRESREDPDRLRVELIEARQLRLWRASSVVSWEALIDSVLELARADADAMVEGVEALTDEDVAVWMRAEAGLLEATPSGAVRLREDRLEIEVPLTAASAALAAMGRRCSPLAREETGAPVEIIDRPRGLPRSEVRRDDADEGDERRRERARDDRPPRKQGGDRSRGWDRDRPRDDRPRDDRPRRRDDRDDRGPRPQKDGDRPWGRKPPRDGDGPRGRDDRRDRPPRQRDDGDRPRKWEDRGDRKPRRDDDRPPRQREDGDRPRKWEGKPRRDDDRPPRKWEDRGDRKPRRDDDRPPRKWEDRKPRGDGDRAPRKWEDRKPRGDGDRAPRKWEDRGDRKPRRDDDRAPRKWEDRKPRGERERPASADDAERERPPNDGDRPPRKRDGGSRW
ncbi:MAG: hypothetical protein AB7S26_24870 [Sandaracinaceae bacterium]